MLNSRRAARVGDPDLTARTTALDVQNRMKGVGVELSERYQSGAIFPFSSLPVHQRLALPSEELCPLDFSAARGDGAYKWSPA